MCGPNSGGTALWENEMFGIGSVADAQKRLSEVYSSRLESGNIRAIRKRIVGPVGLFLIRDDDGVGSQLEKRS